MFWSGRTRRHGRHLKKSVDSVTPRPPDFGSRVCRLQRNPASSESKRAQRFRAFGQPRNQPLTPNSHHAPPVCFGSILPLVQSALLRRPRRAMAWLAVVLLARSIVRSDPFASAWRAVPLSKGGELNRFIRSKSCCLSRFALSLRRVAIIAPCRCRKFMVRTRALAWVRTTVAEPVLKPRSGRHGR